VKQKMQFIERMWLILVSSILVSLIFERVMNLKYYNIRFIYKTYCNINLFFGGINNSIYQSIYYFLFYRP
jgi:hypothetical protein